MYLVWDDTVWRNFGLRHGLQVNTNGTGFTTLHNFTGTTGPYAGLILSGDALYGTRRERAINPR